MAVLKWLWASYKTLRLWQWLAALPIGGGGWGLLAAFTNLPLWQQALLAAGIALIWLTFATRLFQKQEKNTVEQTQSGLENQQANAGGDVTQSSGGPGSGQEAGRDAYAAGRDININTPPTQPQIPWIRRAGGPKLRFHPGFDGRISKLSCSFQITAQMQPGEVEYRYRGLGTDTEWRRPMEENSPGKYQMWDIQLSPNTNRDDNAITLEVRFWLEDGQHGGRWIWPVKARGNGVWDLKQELGSHVFQPRDGDWW